MWECQKKKWKVNTLSSKNIQTEQNCVTQNLEFSSWPSWPRSFGPMNSDHTFFKKYTNWAKLCDSEFRIFILTLMTQKFWAYDQWPQLLKFYFSKWRPVWCHFIHFLLQKIQKMTWIFRLNEALFHFLCKKMQKMKKLKLSNIFCPMKIN